MCRFPFPLTPIGQSVATINTVLSILLLGIGVATVGVPEAEAQSRGGQQSPAQRSTSPAQGGSSTSPSAPAGTKVPSALRPADPPSHIGRSQSRMTPPGRQGQTNSGPSLPEDPSQVPLGGAEWLAAAGAAYALNRLRKEGGEPDDEESDDTP